MLSTINRYSAQCTLHEAEATIGAPPVKQAVVKAEAALLEKRVRISKEACTRGQKGEPVDNQALEETSNELHRLVAKVQASGAEKG